MNNFKPKMCSWLHIAWTEVKEMRNMTIKGCNKISLAKTLKLDFQFVANWKPMLIHHYS
jgi:hypothetical protein